MHPFYSFYPVLIIPFLSISTHLSKCLLNPVGRLVEERWDMRGGNGLPVLEEGMVRAKGPRAEA